MSEHPRPDADVSLETSRLDLSGRLDAATTADLDRRLAALCDNGTRNLLLDLGGATYVSSTVLRTLLLAQRRQQRNGGSLRLVHVPPRIMRILSLAGLDRVFAVDPEPLPQGADRGSA